MTNFPYWFWTQFSSFGISTPNSRHWRHDSFYARVCLTPRFSEIWLGAFWRKTHFYHVKRELRDSLNLLCFLDGIKQGTPVKFLSCELHFSDQSYFFVKSIPGWTSEYKCGNSDVCWSLVKHKNNRSYWIGNIQYNITVITSSKQNYMGWTIKHKNQTPVCYCQHGQVRETIQCYFFSLFFHKTSKNYFQYLPIVPTRPWKWALRY